MYFVRWLTKAVNVITANIWVTNTSAFEEKIRNKRQANETIVRKSDDSHMILIHALRKLKILRY